MAPWMCGGTSRPPDLELAAQERSYDRSDLELVAREASAYARGP
jgi:hypothetical protein